MKIRENLAVSKYSQVAARRIKIYYVFHLKSKLVVYLVVFVTHKPRIYRQIKEILVM
jgi:hypothetical protein